MSSGTDRIKLTYHPAAMESVPLPDKRAKASKVPNTMPPLMAISVNCAVNLRPTQMNGRLGAMTLRSRLANTLPRHRYIAGNSFFSLNRDHYPIGDEGTDEIKDGYGQISLDALLRVFLHLPRLEGKLQHADRECH